MVPPRPASSSWALVPVSKRPGMASPAGRTWKRRQRLEQLAPAPQHTEVRPVELVRRTDQVVGAEGADVDREVRHRVPPHRRRGARRTACARLAICGTGLMVPVALETRPTATRRVRGPMQRSSSSRSSVASSRWMPTQRTIEPCSSAHGQPGGHVGVVVEARDHDLVAGRQRGADGAAERVGDGGHVGPKLTSSASVAPSRSAMARRASWTSSSVSMLAAKGTPWLALLSRR